MFYSTQILAKKGPLGIVWLAAHMDNRLKRNNVFDTNITSSVESIMNPEAPLALRLSGQLLLGVVRIYNRQLVYLYEDCNDTMAKLQQAFRQGDPVLAAKGKTAPAGHITIPEDYQPFGAWDDDDDLDLSGVDVSQLKPFNLEAGRARLFSPSNSNALFASPLSYDNERFEVSGEELERHMSTGPSEVLREAPEPQVQRLFEGSDAGGFSLYDRDDDMLPEVPMDDFIPELPETYDPPSAQPSSRAMSHRRDSLGLGATPMADDDVALPTLEVQPDSVRAQAKKDRAVAAKQRAGEKRKPAQRDVGEDGRPATMLATAAIRALLSDRSALLRDASTVAASQAQHSDKRRRVVLVDWQQQPSIGPNLAEELLALFKHSSSTQGDREPAPGTQNKEVEREPADVAQDEGAGAGEEGSAAVIGGAEEWPQDAYDRGNDFGYDAGFDDFNVDASRTPLSPANRPLSEPLASPGSSRRPGSSRKRQGPEPGAEEEPGAEGYAARTQDVLRQVKNKLSGASGAKKQRLSSAAAQAVPFEELHNNGGRAEAARLFFDLLTLQARKQVVLQQDEAFGRIDVTMTQAR